MDICNRTTEYSEKNNIDDDNHEVEDGEECDDYNVIIFFCLKIISQQKTLDEADLLITVSQNVSIQNYIDDDDEVADGKNIFCLKLFSYQTKIYF